MHEKKKIKPIYIRDVSLEHIKCFGPKQQFFLSKDDKPYMWTIILGDNGTGKSTVLKSIALALSQHEEDGKFMDDSAFSRSDDSEGFIGVNLFSNIENTSKQINEYYLSEEEELVFKPSIKIDVPNLKKYKIPLFGYGSYRKLGSKGFTGVASSFQSLSLFDENASLINAEDWLLRADYEKVKSNLVTDKVERIKTILLKILQEEISDIEIKKKGHGFGVYFKTRYGWVNMENLSTGYKSLITWMIDLANWLTIYYPKSKNPLAEQAVVLVDEIDLHLHVSLQKRLVKFLRETFPNIQFIVTAHSPLIVQGSEEENIIVLEKNGDHVLIKDNPINVKNWRIDQILTSDLFGLESARSNETEAKLKRRYELMAKGHLEESEEKEMEGLKQFMHNVPAMENTKLDEASKIIQSAAEVLKKLKKR